jgi:hypothetical protein
LTRCPRLEASRITPRRHPVRSDHSLPHPTSLLALVISPLVVAADPIHSLAATCVHAHGAGAGVDTVDADAGGDDVPSAWVRSERGNADQGDGVGRRERTDAMATGDGRRAMAGEWRVTGSPPLMTHPLAAGISTRQSRRVDPHSLDPISTISIHTPPYSTLPLDLVPIAIPHTFLLGRHITSRHNTPPTYIQYTPSSLFSALATAAELLNHLGSFGHPAHLLPPSLPHSHRNHSHPSSFHNLVPSSTPVFPPSPYSTFHPAPHTLRHSRLHHWYSSSLLYQ